MAKYARITCPNCKDQPVSRHRHDLNYCRCGSCYVDGGTDYGRIGYEDGWRSDAVNYEIVED